MADLDELGHLAYLNGKSLPGLCYCALNEAHDADPTAPAPGEAYGFTLPPPECPVTGWPQIDRGDLDMCPCGHRHVRIECFGGGVAGPVDQRFRELLAESMDQNDELLRRLADG